MVKEYDYPDVVLKVLSEFISTVTDVLNGKKLGILLVGSTSRGELCWANIEGKLVLYSDIEFMLVVDHINKTCERELSRRINELSSSYDLGERFHLDYVVNKWSNLESMQKKIFIFDCKNVGIDLGENTIKSKLPVVNKENLDFKELNDVLLHRMKSLLNDVPEEIFEDEYDFRTFSLSLAKNTLDITTWLFPYESDYLVSGFENRIEVWSKRKEHILLSKYLDESDFSFLDECIDIRKNPEKLINNTIELLGRYIRIYTHSIAYCKRMNGISSDSDISEDRVSRVLFLEYKIRRRLKEAQTIMLNFKMFSMKNIFTNIFHPRKGKQVKFCFDMLMSLHLFMTSDNENDIDKNSIKLKNNLREMMIIGNKPNIEYKLNWLNLKSLYTDLNKVFI